ncbi:MAG TPA: lamin tail domain-containing protein [bacterium]|nr:lamin tail domain-containing protein [bacterium]
MKSEIQNFYFIIFIIFFATLLIFINTSRAEGLIFSEIMYDPQGTDIGNEWVEVFNNTSSTISITSDFRFNNGSNHVINLISGVSEIEPLNFFIITNNSQNFLNNYPNYSPALFESSFSLNNTSGIIKILQGSNLLVEQSYINTLGANDNGKSLEKIDLFVENNDWQESYIIGGTPGLFSSTAPENIAPIAVINISTTTFYIGDVIFFDASSSTDDNLENLSYFWNIENTTSSSDKIFNYSFTNPGIYNVELIVSDGFLQDSENISISILENNQIDYRNQIIINEFLPNPEGSDNTEWIELKNISDNTINLENFYIKDASGKKYVFSLSDFDNLNLEGEDFFTIDYSVSDITLNNSSDSLYLFDKNDNKIFEISYSNPEEGLSYAYFDGFWEWTNILTKNAENQRQIINRPEAIIDISGDFFTGNEINFSAANSYNAGGGELSYKWYINNYLKSREEQFQTKFDTSGTKLIKLVVTNSDNFSGESIQNIEIKDYKTPTTTASSTISCNFDSKSKIIISEIFPNPKGVDDGEFIELYNPNDYEIDLTNFSLNDTSTYFYKLSNKISAKSFFTLYKEDSKISLNNSNEEIKFYDCNKNIIASVKYEKSIEDKSYSYNFLDDDYFWTDPSPDDDNVFTLENNLIISTDDETLDSFIPNFLGIIVSDPGEIKKNIFYICFYDINNDLVDYENCIEAKSKSTNNVFKKGDVLNFYGEIKEDEDKSTVSISEAEKIKFVELQNPDIFEIDDVLNSNLNSFVSIEGQILKINKKSFYIGDEDNKLKIKFKDLEDLKLQKSDNVYIRGIVVSDGETKAIYIRDKNDVLIQKVLSERESPPPTSTIESLDNLQNKKGDFLGIVIFISSIILIIFFFIKNKLKKK